MPGYHPRTTELHLGGCSLTVFPTVKGLESERGPAREAVARLRPEVVALPVSGEGLRGLRALHMGRQPEFFLSHYEEVYALKLSRYGRVSIPPPSLSEAYAASVELKIPVRAIDMSEEEYASAFCESVSTANLIIHSLRWRWLKRRGFRARTPEEFALAWDRAVNSLRGFRNLETRREEHMAAGLRRLAEEHRTMLAVLELERVEGVLRRLREGWA
ncbi:MAG: hypothetical protein ACUVV6_01850 [Thermoplasmatota archaeon]